MNIKIKSNHINYFDIIGELKRYKTKNEQFLLNIAQFKQIITKLKYYLSYYI